MVLFEERVTLEPVAKSANDSEYQKNYYQKNKMRISKRTAAYKKKNSDKIKLSDKKYYLDNKDKKAEYDRSYHEKNKSRISEKRRVRVRNKRAVDPLEKIKHNLRTGICQAFKVKSWRKSGPTEKLLGISFDLAKAHLEVQFKAGMSWENYGKWHIDHIIPMASAKTKEEMELLCHYTNLQPLWAIDNIRKGART